MRSELRRIEAALVADIPLSTVCVGTAYVMDGNAFRCLRSENGHSFLLEYHGHQFARLTETAVVLEGDAVGKIEVAVQDTEMSKLGF